MEISEQMTREVCYFLGTSYDDPEERSLVTPLIKFAYAELMQKTGVNWLECTSPNYDIAFETVRSKVYMSYYNNRDDSKNTEHLERFIAAKTFSLIYSEEAVKAREAGNGSQ